MGLSLKDLENFGNEAKRRLEEKSHQHGNELAQNLIATTSHGRGLWVIILWPAWIFIFAFSSALLVALIEVAGINSPIKLVGLLGGFFIARAWYLTDFTREHPFWSSMAGQFGLGLAFVFLGRGI